MARRGGMLLMVALLAAGPARADEAAEARALIAQSIAAMGGEAALAKYDASSFKIKGDLYLQGEKVAFTGAGVSQGADRYKITLNLDLMGQPLTIIHALNRDKGWIKAGDEVMDMDEETLAETKEEAYESWVTTLLPLKNQAFTLAPLGEVTLDGAAAVGVRVSRQGHRDVNLYFDKKTHFLVKTEARVKEENGQEVNEESFYRGYEGQEVKHALKITVRRDGKPYLEAELSEIKAEEKLDGSTFEKP